MAGEQGHKPPDDPPAFNREAMAKIERTGASAEARA